MKSNKKLVYFLLPLVIVVWVFFFYRIYTGLYSSNELIIQQKDLFHSGNSHAFQVDTFGLIASYRDPFLGKVVSESEKNNPAVISPKRKVVPAMPWPSIIYSGMIKNQSSKKELAMLQINGQSNLMKPNEIISEVQLIRIYRDSIQVRFGKEKRMIRK
jgi:hypothetical protein